MTDHTDPASRRAILECMACGEPLQPTEIARRTGLSLRAVNNQLVVLLVQERVFSSRRGGHGRYFLTQEAAKQYEAQTVVSVEDKRRMAAQRKKEYRAKLRAKNPKPPRSPVKPPTWDVAPAAAAKARKVANVQEFRAAPAVTPAHVVVQKVPGFTERGRFEPEPGHEGEFMAAWRRARETEPA